MPYRALPLLLVVAVLPVGVPFSSEELVGGGGTGLLGIDAQQALDSRPVSFIPNLGQWTQEFDFLATTGAIRTAFKRGGLLMDVRVERTEEFTRGSVVGWTFEDGVAAAPRGVGLLPGYHNYLLGADERNWRRQVPLYAGLRYEGVWAGVDMVFGERDGHLEYDVVIAPGADVSSVVISCEAVEDLYVERDGTLVMETEIASIRQPAPRTWQVTADGKREEIECAYRVLEGHRFGFEVPSRNSGLLLVIDPGPEAGGIIGEGRADDSVTSIKQRRNQSALVSTVVEHVVAGYTEAGGIAPFPDSGPLTVYQDTFGGGTLDAFVTVLDEDFNVVWATYLGGSGDDSAEDLLIPVMGGVVVVGSTNSGGGTTDPGAFPGITTDKSDPLGSQDGFIAHLSEDGTSMIGCMVLGGNGVETVESISSSGGTESDEVIGWVGLTKSTDFPVTFHAHKGSVSNGNGDGYLAYAGLSGLPGNQGLYYATYIGGTNDPDTSGNPQVDGYDHATELLMTAADCSSALPAAYVAGLTTSSSFIVGPVFDGGTISQDTYGGGPGDAFIARLQPNGDVTVCSNHYAATFVGGTGDDRITGMDYAPVSGTLAFCGETTSADNLMWGGFIFQKDHGSTDVTTPWDGFVGFIKENLNDRGFISYLGGAGDDHALDIALMPGSSPVLTRAVVVGKTQWDSSQGSDAFPTRPGAYQSEGGGALSGLLDHEPATNWDAFIAVVTQVKNRRLLLDYSSFLGGSNIDEASKVTVDEDDGVPIVVGSTLSDDFPYGVPPTAGNWSGFAIKFDPTPSPHQDPQFFTYGGGTFGEDVQGISVAPTLYGLPMEPGPFGGLEVFGEAGQTSKLDGIVGLNVVDGLLGPAGFLFWSIYGPDDVDLSGCGHLYIAPPAGWTPFNGGSGTTASFEYTIPTDPLLGLAGLQINWQAVLSFSNSSCGFLLSNGLQQTIGS